MLASILAHRISKIILVATVVPFTLALVFFYQYINKTNLINYQEKLALSAEDLARDLSERLEFIGAELNFIATYSHDEDFKANPQFSKLFKDVYIQEGTKFISIKNPNNTIESIKLPPFQTSRPNLVLINSQDKTAIYAMAKSRTGILLADINQNFLWQLGSSIYARNSNICIISGKKTLVCSNKNLMSSDEIIDNKKNVFSIHDNVTTNNIAIPKLRIISFANEKDIISSSMHYFIGAMITLFGFILLIFVGSKMLISYMMSPLAKIRLQILKYVDKVDPLNSKNELDSLVDSINMMGTDLADRKESLKTMAKIDQIILSSMDINSIIANLGLRIKKLLHANSVFLHIRDIRQSKKKHNFFMVHSRSRTKKNYKLPSKINNILLKNGSHVLVDLIEQQEYKEIVQDQKSIFCTLIPICINNDLAAFVEINHTKMPEYSKDELNETKELANRFAVAIVNAAKEDQLYHHAHYDLLTDLPNRLLFHDKLEQAIFDCHENNSNLALLYIDLNKFKALNDAFGHIAGDEYLKKVAKSITESINNKGIAARIGGDEFVVILPNLKTDNIINEVSLLANEIQHEIAKPCNIDGNRIVLNSSIGIALFPLDADNSTDLLKAADAALYYAKNNTISSHQFYSLDIDDDTKELILLENNLSSALANNELELHFQPRINLKTNKVVSAEALIRWKKNNSYISPDDFIPIAEDNGLIQSMGEWILRNSCQALHRWQSMGVPTSISINLSTVQFQNTALLTRITSLIDEYQLNPACIELELTESILMHKSPHIISVINQLKDLGVKLAIDDFGTGYSSISYLRDFPIDIIKIDKSFIRNIENDFKNSAIVSSIIELAKNLSLRVVGEGVETIEELTWLKRHNCDEIQGYIYSKPLPASNFEKYLVTNTMAEASIIEYTNI